MSGADRTAAQFTLHRRGQLEQPHRIGNVAARLSDTLSDALLCQCELLDETAVAFALIGWD